MTGQYLDNLMARWWQLGGAAGVLFVVLFIVGAVILQSGIPMVDDSPSEIRSYFVDHPKRYMVGDFLIGLGFVFGFLPFAAVLRSYLGAAEGGAAICSRLLFAGAVLATAVGAATSGLQGALAYSATSFTDDNILKTIVHANYYTFTTAVPFFIALTVLAASLVILRTGALWPWLGWLGLVLAFAAIISTLAVLDDDPEGPFGILGFIVFIVWGIWTLAASLGLIMRKEVPAATLSM